VPSKKKKKGFRIFKEKFLKTEKRCWISLQRSPSSVPLKKIVKNNSKFISPPIIITSP
jgi:hypothetical protein